MFLYVNLKMNVKAKKSQAQNRFCGHKLHSSTFVRVLLLLYAVDQWLFVDGEKQQKSPAQS